MSFDGTAFIPDNAKLEEIARKHRSNGRYYANDVIEALAEAYALGCEDEANRAAEIAAKDDI